MDNLFDFLKKEEVKEEPIKKVSKEKSKYDQNKYNKNFLEKNRNKIKEKVLCDICCGSYTYFNKSKHLNSKKHQNIVNKYIKNAL